MDDKKITRQFMITPAEGKRIIAKSMLLIPSIIHALKNRTVVIIAGTTNGYIAEEILKKTGSDSEFRKERFFRGITLPHNYSATDKGRIPDESGFIGDVVIEKGKWKKGKTIFDVADDLKKGDVIIKGANALDIKNGQAAVYIGDLKAGTILKAVQAVLGRRVELFLPVGLEKRVSTDLYAIAKKINSPDASGPRFFPVSGNVVTELDAVEFLTGAEAELVAAGGVCGAEGSCWIAVTGTKDEVEKAGALIKSTYAEPPFSL